ncbi:MAG: 50S ribosomal protein L32 [Bacteroidota bacterium]|nr:50S ribosomal protein L32 [Bacteroidota bacterium]
MPNPKHKHSKSRTRTRRAHDKAIMPSLMLCTNCGSPVLYHRMCTNCGHYRGKMLIEKTATA